MAESITDARPAKPDAPIRRQLGRFLDALAICMVAVPIFLIMAFPVERLPAVAHCGESLENNTLTFGLTFLVVKSLWKVLNTLNDASDRYLTRIDEAARSRYLAQDSASDPKPQPLDDF